jgi:hypothetical protein
VFGTKLCAHLTGKQWIMQLAFSDINWDAMELATDLFPPLYHLCWVSKHVSGFFWDRLNDEALAILKA